MKAAMVWGASGDIGRALTEMLIDQEWQTVAIARDSGDLSDLNIEVYEADLTDPSAIEAAIYSTALEVDAINLWVYAAGDITSGKIKDLAPDDWDRIMTANLDGAFRAVHYSLPLLAEDAHLVFLGAVSERMRLPGLSAYAAAKAGLEAMADSLAKEERKRRITVIRPGAVDTKLWDKVPMSLPAKAASPEKVAQEILRLHAEGQSGRIDLT